MAKRNNLIMYATIAVLALSLVALFVILYDNNVFSKPLSVLTFNATANITDTVGFDISKDKFSFGNLVPGTSLSRSATFHNDYDFPVFVDVHVSGDIEQLLSYQERFEVAPLEEISISITAFADLNDEPGFYEGEVIFYIGRLG